MKKTFIFSLLLISGLFAQSDSITYNPVSYMFGSGTNASAHNGNYLYTNTGNTVRVFEMDSDYSLTELGNVRLSCSIDRIKYHNNHLYISSNNGSIAVIDVTEPSAPSILFDGSNCSINPFVDFDVEGDRLLTNFSSPAISGFHMFNCYNIEEPDSMFERNTLILKNSPALPSQGAINNSHLYILNPNLDMSCDDWELPITISVYDISSGSEAEEVISDLCFNYGFDIAVNDTMLYLLNETQILFYNISDPESLIYINTTLLDETISSESIDFVVTAGTAIISNSDNIIIYHIEDDLSLTRIHSLTRDASEYNVSVSDTLLFIHNENYEIEIVNLNESYTDTDTINLSEYNEYCRRMVKKNNYLICGTRDGLKVLDITSPETPVEISSYPIIVSSEMEIDRHFLFAPTIDNGVVILNITDMLSISEIARIDTNVYSLIVDNHTLYYLSEGSSTETCDLNVYNVEYPYSTRLLRVYEDMPEIRNFAVYNNKALFIFNDNHLEIAELTDTPLPTVLYTETDISSNSKLEQHNSLVYLNSSPKFNIYNLAASDSNLVYSNDSLGSSYSLEIENGIALISTPDLVISDMSNPLNIIFYDTLNFECNPFYQMIIDEHYLYTKHADGALLVYELSELPTPQNNCPIIPGWNLVSYPYEDFPEINSVLPSVETPAYLYDSESRAHASTPILFKERGFWALSSNFGDFEIDDSHIPADSVTLEILPGWNLIGGPNSDIPASIFESIPEIESPIFYYNNYEKIYEFSDTLRSHKGYWILATDSVEVRL